MKKLLLLILIIGCKTSKNYRAKTYKKVDTVDVYDNCQVITFMGKHNKLKKDTVPLPSDYGVSINNKHVVFNVHLGEILNVK